MCVHHLLVDQTVDAEILMNMQFVHVCKDILVHHLNADQNVL